MKQIEISLLVGALSGLILWFYYSKIKNTHIRDDQLSERGCCLFSFLIFAGVAFIDILRDFNLWSVAGLIVCVKVICTEIFEKIPHATRIEEAKKNKKTLYMSCGLIRMPPNYDLERRS